MYYTRDFHSKVATDSVAEMGINSEHCDKCLHQVMLTMSCNATGQAFFFS